MSTSVSVIWILLIQANRPLSLPKTKRTIASFNTVQTVASILPAQSRFIRLIVQKIGIDCRTGVIQVPVIADDVASFTMSYQHDLLLYQANQLKVIGSIKTSSKDRLDKIFIDKFLYNRLTSTTLPHIAIFLNDVQRKQTKTENRYAINGTFLPGHFKGYTIKLNPLDGVYYCDLRPSMSTDPFLSRHIQTIDHLFCDDLPGFLQG
jgi:hypothetical protein